jgi:hypothetical protein
MGSVSAPFINTAVPGADQYYPLNDPLIGSALPEVDGQTAWRAENGTELL